MSLLPRKDTLLDVDVQRLLALLIYF